MVVPSHVRKYIIQWRRKRSSKLEPSFPAAVSWRFDLWISISDLTKAHGGRRICAYRGLPANLNNFPEVVRIKVIRNGSPPLAIAQPALLSLHSDILAILISIYSADQILDPR